MNRLLLMTVALFGFAAAALGQWGSGGCSAQVSVDTIEWRELPGDEGRIYLYRNGRQVGGWDYGTGQWRDYDGVRDAWSAPRAQPPAEPPGRVVQNFGVDSAKLHGGSRFQLNGHDVTRTEALDAIHAKIPEESKKFRVTIIGTSAERKRVTDAYQNVDAHLRERTSVWSVPPEHWSLTDTAAGKPIFRGDGKPTIYFQAPDGKVLHRQGDFAGAQDFEAIRKAVKNYDDAKDPDLRKPLPAPVPPAPTNALIPGIALLLGLLGYVFITRRR